jgi:hypothetical protein
MAKKKDVIYFFWIKIERLFVQIDNTTKLNKFQSLAIKRGQKSVWIPLCTSILDMMGIDGYDKDNIEQETEIEIERPGTLEECQKNMDTFRKIKPTSIENFKESCSNIRISRSVIKAISKMSSKFKNQEKEIIDKKYPVDKIRDLAEKVFIYVDYGIREKK